MSVQKKVIIGISIVSILLLSFCSGSSCGSDAHVENTEILAKKITYEYYKKYTGDVGLDTFISDSYVVKEERSRRRTTFYSELGIFTALFPYSYQYDVYFSYSDDLSGELTYRWAMVFLGKCNDYHDHFSRKITKQEYISITQPDIDNSAWR